MDSVGKLKNADKIQQNVIFMLQYIIFLFFYVNTAIVLFTACWLRRARVDPLLKGLLITTCSRGFEW